MAIERFENESVTQLYEGWRIRNPHGYVLNINIKNPGTSNCINIIHRAGGCASLDSPPIVNRDRPVTIEHPKLCSTDAQELIKEMQVRNLPYKACGRCKPEIL
ncbi:hypothetical protein [Mesobacillus selenatarsenatis]|uniref:hypothetical protein n=1 Tax=Mesobacillus selenatarsenatis TaxID=388741 RepID=UPI0005A9381D|nr:hypothetical protein [Mesobacillus selenatarsenatis]